MRRLAANAVSDSLPRFGDSTHSQTMTPPDRPPTPADGAIMRSDENEAAMFELPPPAVLAAMGADENQIAMLHPRPTDGATAGADETNTTAVLVPPPSYQDVMRESSVSVLVKLYRYRYVHTSTTSNKQRIGPLLEHKTDAATINPRTTFNDFVLTRLHRALDLFDWKEIEWPLDPEDMQRLAVSVTVHFTKEGKREEVAVDAGNWRAVRGLLLEGGREVSIAMAPGFEGRLELKEVLRCGVLRVFRGLSGRPGF